MVFSAEDDLGCAVEPRLDIQKIGLVDEHARAEVDYLDAHLRLVLHQHVLRLEVAVDHAQLLQEGQRGQQLDGKGADVVDIQGPEVVGL
jgi:hypothetical protein